MKRFWVSWFSGNYADEGCTKPPFKFWVSGQRNRVNDGLNTEQLKQFELITDEEQGQQFLNINSRDDCSICAVIDSESENDVWELVSKHFPDFDKRFCEERALDFNPGPRFP